LILARVQ